MNFGNLTATRALKGVTCAAALAASVTFASFEAAAQASVVLNEPADGSSVTVYTADGNLPPSLNQGTSATASTNVNSVTFSVQGGSLENMGEQQSDGVNWVGVVDLTDGANSTNYVATVQAVAESDGYYNQNADIAIDTADVNVTVLMNPDGDGDSVPDADQITTLVPAGQNATFPGTGQSGDPITTGIANITGSSGGTINAVVMIDGYYGTGATAAFSVTTPSLTDLQTAFPSDTTVQGATDAIVLVTFAANSGDLTTDAGDNPADSLPAALGAFARVHILLSSDGTTWTSFETTLPAAVALDAVVTITGVQDTIARVRQYLFALLFAQSGNNFTFAANATDWVANGDSNDGPSGTPPISVSDNVVMTSINEPGNIHGWVATAGGGGGDDDDDGGTCFIATAAYGTPMAQEINTLREVRDSYMLNNVLGSMFVDTYYRVSPAIADKVAESPALAAVVRAALTPFILLGKALLAAPMAVVAFLMAGAGLVLAHRRTRGQQS